jgi:hypothetical protein
MNMRIQWTLKIPLVVMTFDNTSALAWLPITLKVPSHFHMGGAAF